MLAVVFPGQGSQYVGMGREVLEHYPEAEEVFSLAEETTGLPVKALCLEGPEEELTRTDHLQVALTAVNLAVWKVLEKEGLSPAFLAGHSLGEFSALAASGICSLEDVFRLVKRRGELMHKASEYAPGAMYAVLGLSRETLKDLLSKIEGRVYLANHNSPEQIVISGEEEAAAQVAAKAKEAGARLVKLKVSGAFHSPLMEPAARVFEELIQSLPFSSPSIPVVFNVSAVPEKDPARIKDLVAQQMLSPVRWVESVEYMYEAGVRLWVEAGPKKVLSGLIRKTLAGKEVEVWPVEKVAEIQALSSKLRGQA